jgi:hypothetical protein
MSVPALTDEELSYFVREVKLQCSLALLAYKELRGISSEIGKAGTDIERLTLYTFALVTHVGNLSKLFNSPRTNPTSQATDRQRERADIRCKQLKETLKFGPDMNSYWRRTRDYIEHYDEKLDDWLMRPDRKPLIDMAVEERRRRSVDTNGMSRIEAAPSHQDHDYHRYYDPNIEYLHVGEQSFRLDKALMEVEPLQRCAEDWLSNFEAAARVRSKSA